MQNNIQFPIEVFPIKIQELIKEYSNALNCSTDFIAVAILSCASAIIGNSRKVQGKNTWIESTTLYMCMVGDPSSKKTPVLKLLLEPLRKIQADHKIKSEKEDFKGRPQQIITNDLTIESLAPILDVNFHGIAIVVDELIGWINSFNQYKSNGNDKQKYLELYNGNQLIINRKGDKKHIQIDDPFITVFGGIQTDYLNQLKGSINDGFIERMLFSFPDKIKHIGHTENEVSNETIQWYSKFMIDLYGELHKDSSERKFRTLQLSPLAKKIWIDWQNNNVEKITKQDEAMYLKMNATALRMSLILQQIMDFKAPEISESAMRGSVKICDYFISNYKKVNHHIVGEESQKGIDQSINWMVNQIKMGKAKNISGTPALSIRAFYTGKVAGCKNRNLAMEMFELLVEQGYGSISKMGSKPNAPLYFKLNKKYWQ